MNKLLFLIFLVVVESELEILVEPIVYSSKPKDHHFLTTYNHIRQNVEGNYVNHVNDKGGETYGGIARRVHPTWEGWYILDDIPNKQRHQYVPEVEYHVKDWYLTLWVIEGFETINDQSLALNLYDFRIQSSPRTVTKLTNRVLIQMGCEPIQIGPDWVDDRFNQVDPQEFILRLKIQRLLLFNYLANKDESQKVFIYGWYKRLETI